MEEQNNPAEYFTDSKMIPLIVFGYSGKEIINTLNSLLHYYVVIMEDKDFKDRDWLQEKAKLYEMKIKEGLDFAKFVEGPGDYFKSQVKEIQGKLDFYADKANKKAKKKRVFNIIKYTVAIIILIEIFRSCKNMLQH